MVFLCFGENRLVLDFTVYSPWSMFVAWSIVSAPPPSGKQDIDYTAPYLIIIGHGCPLYTQVKYLFALVLSVSDGER